MKSTIIKSKELHWCNDQDRFVLVTKENNQVIGLNYMQGDDCSDLLQPDLQIDQDLTRFFLILGPYLNGRTEIEKINQAIWAHLDYQDIEITNG
jgi:hypothetical protein